MIRRPPVVLAHWPGLDLFSAADLDRFDEVGRLLDRTPLTSWTDARGSALLAEAEAVVGHWGCPRLDATALDATPRLGLFAYAAGTVKDVVSEEVFERGIRVTSGANANAEPVAEFTVAAILWANKDVMWKRGSVDDFDPVDDISPNARGAVPLGNFDKTIGIIGASHVGRRVIALLAAFPRLDVLLCDPWVDAEEATALGVRLVDLDELCRRSDVVSVHAPALPSTHHLIAHDQLAAMRDGATLINTARGELVDHRALIAELGDGRLRAVLDVTDPEPLPSDSVLRILPNVWLSPHLAGSQGTEVSRLAEFAAEEIRRWAAGEPALNEITEDRRGRLA